jgi:glycosyltransferase involved in cell wall biosynthesis
VIVRGHQANPWELAPWEQPAVAERYDVSYLRSARGWFDTTTLSLQSRRAWTLRDLLPPGALGDLAVRLPGERYLGLRSALAGADIVHSQELGYWYSMQAARLRARLGFRLVLTVWETIPLLDAYRNVRTRAYRAATLAATDLFLAATERARESLLLEGAAAERIRVCPPGIALERFEPGSREPGPAAEPLILSPGRLVWEKGHQDVMRALAHLRLRPEAAAASRARLLLVGKGPEERRLRAYAAELGIADAVEFRGFVPYDEMPAVYAHASAVVLASLPTWSWEEQFGMVLAEAMAAGTPIVASASGAIPEVAGAGARYFAAGDWLGLAGALEELIAVPDRDPVRAAETRERSALYSAQAAAARLAAAYDELLAAP